MAAVARGDHAVLQPLHWLIEVAAVMERETPGAFSGISSC
jgi:hypothetical protein